MSTEEKEILRRVVLGVLAARHPTAIPLKAVRRWATTETGFAFTDLELESALEFWLGDAEPKVACEWDTAGASKWWSATTAGVRAVERGA